MWPQNVLRTFVLLDSTCLVGLRICSDEDMKEINILNMYSQIVLVLFAQVLSYLSYLFRTRQDNKHWENQKQINYKATNKNKANKLHIFYTLDTTQVSYFYKQTMCSRTWNNSVVKIYLHSSLHINPIERRVLILTYLLTCILNWKMDFWKCYEIPKTCVVL